MEIGLNPGVVPRPTPAGPLERDRYTLMGTFASVFARPLRVGDHESLEAGEALVEEGLQWKWLR